MASVTSVAQEPKTQEPPVVKVGAPVEERQASAADRQFQSKPTTPEFRSPAQGQDKVFFAAPGDGAVWARGKSYKARFGADSTDYIPFLGAKAPQNYPLAMSISSVTVGGQPIGFDANVAPQHDGTTVSFRRGSFTEFYEMQLESVEQLFTFDSLPAAGELVVRIAVTTELDARDTGTGFEFANELGGVRYGQAITVDAAGVRTPATTIWDGESIQIRVPAEVVDSATFPLTIDPVILSISVDTTTEDDFAADVAFDSGSSTWLVIYERIFSSTDHDVFSESYSSAGTFQNSDYPDFTTDFWANPAVASNGAVDQYLVVAQVGSPSGNARIIRGVRVDPTPFTIGTQFTISSAVQSGEKFNPDVGGDPFTSTPSNWLVVWQRDFAAGDQDVHAALVTSAGAAGATFLINDTAGTVDTKPQVSKSNLTSNWNVVWQRDFSSTDGDIYGARIEWDGTITNGSFVIDASTSDHTNPAVSSALDSSNARYVVVFEHDFSTDHDVRALFMNGTAILDNMIVNGTDGGPLLQDQIQPSVDSDGRHFAVAYSESFQDSSTDYDIWVTDLFTSGNDLGIAEGHENLAFSGTGEFRPQIASRNGGGGTNTGYMAVWDDFFGTGDHDIEAAIYNGISGGPVTSFCAGDGTGTACPCGNSGTTGHGCANSVNAAGALLTATGNASTSADTLVLHGTLLPATATGLFFQGTTQVSAGSGAVFGDGKRCTAGTVIRMATKTAVGGAVNFPTGADPDVSVKGAIPAVGATRHYQLWYRNANVFCTVSTFNLTNGVSAVWTP